MTKGAVAQLGPFPMWWVDLLETGSSGQVNTYVYIVYILYMMNAQSQCRESAVGCGPGKSQKNNL